MIDNKMPLWKKIIIVLCSLMIIAALILTGYVKRFVEYNLQGVPVSEFEYNSQEFEKLHIGNITYFNDEGLLDSMTSEGIKVTIGKTAWYYTTDIDFNNRYFGELLGILSYENDNVGDPNNGEQAQLWIFSPSESQYKNAYSAFVNDPSTEMKGTEDFKPYKALTTGPKVRFKGDSLEYGEGIYILANERIYCFKFTNDKIFEKFRKYNKDKQKEMAMEAFSKFDKRCKSIINNFDLASYPSYNKYKVLEQKQKEDRFNWQLIFCASIIILSILIFVLSLKKIGYKNRNARSFAIYCIICFILSVIGSIIGILLTKITDDYYAFENITGIIGCFVSSVVFCSIIGHFLTLKSNEEYENFWIIPKWVKKQFGLRKEFKKRLLAVIIFYPLFAVSPLPMGFMFFGLYIIPVSIIYLLAFIIYWIFAGRKIDSQQITKRNESTLYCRFCGKPIEEDSEYCPHCGKKL